MEPQLDRDDLPVKKLCPCGCGRYLPEPVRILHVGPAGKAIEDWLAEQNLTLEDLKRQDHRPEYVELRRRVVKFLHEHSWPISRISNFLDRDRTSIRNMLEPKKR
jgi:hypothetical protein